MSKKGEERGKRRMPPGKAQINVYLPEDLVERLRADAESELRGLSATVQIALERYLASKNLETARTLRTVLEEEGYPTT